jgi:hypothetical protein
MLRAKAANLLSELAVPSPANAPGSISETIDILRNRGVLDTAQAGALRDTFEIADRAAGGAAVPPRVTVACENSGAAILDQLALLRAVAAVRFEDYVLGRLCRELPARWSVEIDAAIQPGEFVGGTAPVAPPMVRRLARVDALIRNSDRSTIVEIRARLQPSSPVHIDALREWLAALPPHLPVLLVVLGEGLTLHQLEQLRLNRGGTLDLLDWDRSSGSMITRLAELLDTSGSAANVG